MLEYVNYALPVWRPINQRYFFRYRKGRIGIRYGRRWRWLSRRPLKFRFGRRWRSLRFYRGKPRIRFRGKLTKLRIAYGKLRLLNKRRWTRPRTRRMIRRRRRRRRRRRLRRRKRRARRRRRRRGRGRRRIRRCVMRVGFRGRFRKIYKRRGRLIMRWGRRFKRVRWG